MIFGADPQMGDRLTPSTPRGSLRYPVRRSSLRVLHRLVFPLVVKLANVF